MSYEDLSSEKNEEKQEKKLLEDLKRLGTLSGQVLTNSKIIAEALSKNNKVQ